MELVSPKLFYRTGHLIRRRPVRDSFNMFVFEDEDSKGLPKQSAQTASSLVYGVVNSGPFGDQSRAKVVDTIYDHPFWEVYVDLDREAFSDERWKRRARLAEFLSKFELHSGTLKSLPSYDIGRYYPEFSKYKYAKTKVPYDVSMNRVIGHMEGDQSWGIFNDEKLKRVASEIIGGTTYWKEPVEFIKIGGLYWCRSGGLKVAAAKLLGEDRIPYAYVIRYSPVDRIKGVFPYKKYWRTLG